jgi:sugar lactone lactonase YvrE
MPARRPLPLLLALVALVALASLAYLALWPVPVAPVAWQAPPDPGHTGLFGRDSLLVGAERIAIGPHTGPEGLARDAAGRIYAGTIEGVIVRLAADGSAPEVFVRTGGRPLGLAFDRTGTLWVADSDRGLLAVDTLGAVRLVADSVEGTAIGFADDLDVADDGRVYLSDASTKFPPRAAATEDASVLDIVEHGGHGRLLEHDPATGRTVVLRAGLQFANGVAVAHDQGSVLVNETGAYRVMRVVRDGPRRGEIVPVIEALPGFPDNLTRGSEGRYWVALFAPRNALLDRLSGWPRLRKVLLRIPRPLRPKPAAYGHVIAIDDAGRVRDDRHDPTGAFPKTTSVLETPTHLYLGSLEGPVIARVPR